jgi:hypothetical protein
MGSISMFHWIPSWCPFVQGLFTALSLCSVPSLLRYVLSLRTHGYQAKHNKVSCCAEIPADLGRTSDLSLAV